MNDRAILGTLSGSFLVSNLPYQKDTVFEKVFSDEPKFTKKSLQLDKVSSKGNPINGVVFKVEFFDTELDGVDYDGTDSGANMEGGGGRGDTLSLNDENYAVVNDTEDALWRYCRCGL